MRPLRTLVSSGALVSATVLCGAARGQEPPAAAPASSAPAPASTAPVVTSTTGPTKVQMGQHFEIDPVSDGVLTATSLGFGGILTLILSTGEIKPQPASPADVGSLLSIDRGAVSEVLSGSTDPHAGMYSDIGLYSAIGFACLDPLLSASRDGWDAALVDSLIYAESLSLTLLVEDLTKIAVRRPRPVDYVAGASSSNTDLSLSFFSGHTATVAAVTGTATYLAFVRSPNSPRPWITLALGTALTTFVGIERVRSGEHFPTDVIAGAMAGGAIGVVIPHWHRHKAEAPPLWIGAAPSAGGGGVLSLTGRF